MAVKNLHRASTFDPYSGAQVVMDIVHYRGHLGNNYMITYVDNAVADSSSTELLIRVGASYSPHMTVIAASTATAEFLLFEGTTVSGNGTDITAYNRNRYGRDGSDSLFSHTPTVTGAGTQLAHHLLPGGAKSKASGGEDGSGYELVLAVNTNYLIRLTNTSGGNADHHIDISFYQSIDGTDSSILT